MDFYPGLDIEPTVKPMGFRYGEGCFGPQVENRKLDDIRKSLKDPTCIGPEIVYAIAMDVGKLIHKQILEEKMLLFGLVTYAQGRLGNEPVRSQGHIHRPSEHSGWSPPEIYEIWSGKAVIYMQEFSKDNPGKCYAVYAEPGDIVIVPPYWAHATISADSSKALTFGAWCDREYGFLYDDVRAHNGLAWFPVISSDNSLEWLPNNSYQAKEIIVKRPNEYLNLGIRHGIPIYQQFEQNYELFQFVSKPYLKEEVWKNFIP